jgi:hypothetical protein
LTSTEALWFVQSTVIFSRLSNHSQIPPPFCRQGLNIKKKRKEEHEKIPSCVGNRSDGLTIQRAKNINDKAEDATIPDSLIVIRMEQRVCQGLQFIFLQRKKLETAVRQKLKQTQRIWIMAMLLVIRPPQPFRPGQRATRPVKTQLIS